MFEGAVRGISAIATNTAHTDALDGALASLAREATTAVGDLERMIAIDTSFPPGAGYGAFADLLEELASALGFDCQAVLVPQRLWQGPDDSAAGERINLIAVRRTGRPICGLYFHTDTVPPAADWMRPPFALTREGSHLYGLGAADMKGSMAAALLALRAACASRIELAYDPMLLFCTDEEGGLYPGIRYLAEQGLLEGHVLSFNGGAVPRIWAGCFGSINLLIRIHGRAAHAGDGDGRRQCDRGRAASDERARGAQSPGRRTALGAAVFRPGDAADRQADDRLGPWRREWRRGAVSLRDPGEPPLCA